MIVSIVAFTNVACANILTGGRGSLVTNEGQLSNMMIEQIVAAISAQDSDTMRQLFSDLAIGQDDNFESSMKILFDVFNNKTLIEEDDSLLWSSHEEVCEGKKSKAVTSLFVFNAEDEKYKFYIINYAKDTIDPQNAGLFCLYVWPILSDDDTGSPADSWEDLSPGIHILDNDFNDLPMKHN